MIGRSTGHRVSITGLGAFAPERVMTNDELSMMVDTSDEWIIERTGIRERRVAGPDEALSDVCLPAAREALAQAGIDAADLDMVIVATVTPDMVFPATAALIANELHAVNAGAYDLSAGCTGFVYAVAQAHAMVASGLSQRILVIGGDVLTKILDWTDRSTCVLFGDGAGAVVLERVEEGGFLGFELGADGGGGMELYLPAGGSRLPITPEVLAAREHLAHMNGREVFKFATRILVTSAQAMLDEVGMTVDDIDVYVPHQANIRIIDHAARKLGIPDEKVVVNVDRYGNTSSGSIPLALADAVRDGRIRKGTIVLLTGMGAGLTWGSSVMEWTYSTSEQERAR